MRYNKGENAENKREEFIMCGFEGKNGAGASEKALEMCANIDDMTAEDLSAAMDVLLGAGALDVWFEHIRRRSACACAKWSARRSRGA